MDEILVYAGGRTPALRHGCRELAKMGIRVTDEPSPAVTHLLLPAPAFEKDGRIKGGGALEHILADLPEGITVIGGNLDHPILVGYNKMDLLQDGTYVARNAAITADGAVRLAGQYMDTVFEGCPVLIIGWGRIGKCLGRMLKALGADVTIAARKATDRDLAAALGYGVEDPAALEGSLRRYEVIFNTVPAMVLDDARIRFCRKDCVKIELASAPGMAGSDVIDGRGLPGKLTPAASGRLIAQTVKRLIVERTE